MSEKSPNKVIEKDRETPGKSAQEAEKSLKIEVDTLQLQKLQDILAGKQRSPSEQEKSTLLLGLGLSNAYLESPNMNHSGFRLTRKEDHESPSGWGYLTGKLSILSPAFIDGAGQGICKIDFNENGKIIHILAEGKTPIFGSKFGAEATHVTGEYGEQTDLTLGKNEVYYSGNVIPLSLYQKRVKK